MPNDEACFARSIVRDFQATVDPKAAARAEPADRWEHDTTRSSERIGEHGVVARIRSAIHHDVDENALRTSAAKRINEKSVPAPRPRPSAKLAD